MLSKRAEVVKGFCENLSHSKLSEEEKVTELRSFATNKKYLSYWFVIDDELRKRYENSDWFWLVRRVRNTM